MRFHTEKCHNNCFEDHVLKQEQNYDYVWCNLNVDVHQHKDFYELFFLAGGPSYHYYNGEEKQIIKNSVFFFKPGECHGLYKTSPDSYHFSFFAKAEFFEHFFDENPTLRNAFCGKKYLMCELSDLEYEYIYKLASMLVHQENESRQVSLFLYNVISLLIIYNNTEPKEAKNVYVTDLVEKLNNYTYLTHKIQDIYAFYPIAKCTLIKEFKKYTGMTIVQYQRKQKLIYAAQLLANSDCPIIEIAENLQFDSFSHFLRIFKEYYGVTPKKYRNMRTQKKI